MRNTTIALTALFLCAASASSVSASSVSASSVSASSVSAGPVDSRVVINEYSQYFPGDFRYPELVLEVPRGGQLFFVNADVVSGSQGWGAHTFTELVPEGSYLEPRFTTPTLEPGEFAEVSGISSLETGVYDFYCDTHGAAVMRGKITIT